MAFKSVNEISAFSFEDCMITKFEYKEKEVYMELEALIVKANNSQNTNYTESYAGPTQVRLQGAKVISGYQEGSKYYDANDVLLSEIPDRPFSKEELQDFLKTCEGNYLYCMEPVKEAEGSYEYSMGIEYAEDNDYGSTVRDSFRLNSCFEKAIFEWDRYMNRVQR